MANARCFESWIWKQRAFLFVLPIAVAWCILLCQGESAAPAIPAAPIRFRNVASSAGIDFVLENGATPEKHVIETMVGGVAAFDFDGDGLTDIFFANGATTSDSPRRRLLNTGQAGVNALDRCVRLVDVHLDVRACCR